MGRSIGHRLAILGLGLVLLTSCATTISGTAARVGDVVQPIPVQSSGSTPPSTGPIPVPSTGPTQPSTGRSGDSVPTSSGVPDSEVGLKQGVTPPKLTVADDAHTKYDQLAEYTLADLYTFYGQVFPQDFGQKFIPPAHLQSYDSTDKAAVVCKGLTDKNFPKDGIPLYNEPNAMYVFPPCDTIVWDRKVMLPQLEQKSGELATPTVLAHEMGHRVQTQLKFDRANPTIVAEQQADCYAGAYWKWVADGHSSYFNFNQTAGMRQVLIALAGTRDPVGGLATDQMAHGNGFDRAYAFGEGYAGGADRCNKMDAAEIQQRHQQFPFTYVPTNSDNIPISDDFLKAVAETVDSYFGQTAAGYKAPTLTSYTGQTPPSCPGFNATFPVGYCPATNTVTYNLAELQRIGTPTAGFESVSGDFSAVLLLVSRYALAAQAAGGSPITGNAAGMRALCYAGTWATWMRDPQGPKKLQLSVSDVDKAVFEVIDSPLPASDVNGSTTTVVIDQVQALGIGVTQPITTCFDQYPG